MGLDSDNLLDLVREILADGKGGELIALPAAKQSGGLFGWIVMVTASSARHASALAERLLRGLKNAGLKNCAVEKSDDSSWILIDAGGVIVHVMLAETRAHYNLESLWKFEEDAAT